MLAQKLTDQSVLDQIQTTVEAEVEAAARFAMDAPFPAQSEVAEDVYA